MPGGFISLSANGTSDGILWITLPGKDRGRILAVLANNPLPHRGQLLPKLWEDETEDLRGVFFSRNNPPTVADGRVFVGTVMGKFFVYGLAGDRPLVHLPPVIVPVARVDPLPSIKQLLGQLSTSDRAVLAPPQGHRPFSLATVSGALTYKARTRDKGAVEWVLASLTGELRDESGIDPRVGYNGLGSVLATVDHGLTWTTPDDTQMTWSVEKSVKAPEAGNAPWVLFRSTAGGAPDDGAGSAQRDLTLSGPLAPAQSGGVLDAVTYVQQMGTEGGAPPPQTRAHIGDRVDVAFTATYAFYVAETDNNDENKRAH